MSFFQIALWVIAFYFLFVLIRIIAGPTIWDRLLSLNLISAKIITAIVILAVLLNKSYLLDIALVYAVLGFIGTVFIARFIERSGKL